jgi:DNA-binding HxlR family transcriptional regulator
VKNALSGKHLASTDTDLPARGDLYNRHCPTRQVLDHVMGRWGGLILGALRGRTLRFAELRRAVDGVSEKMLSQTLRELERDGLVNRNVLPVIPPHVEYTLTDLGSECAARVWALADWIEENLQPLAAAQRTYDQKLNP